MAPGSAHRFDDEYYRRFYGDDGVHDADAVAHLATAVHEMTAWWGIKIASVLDVGAGTGLWRDWYHDTHPDVRVRSIDISEHACTTWGHERRDISTWQPPHKFDLVICHGVLHYLDDDALESAVHHLAVACRHVLYLEVPTARDLRESVDPARTDFHAHRRSAARYRRLLEGSFRQAGAGLWTRRDDIVLYELEAARL